MNSKMIVSRGHSRMNHAIKSSAAALVRRRSARGIASGTRLRPLSSLPSQSTPFRYGARQHNGRNNEFQTLYRFLSTPSSPAEALGRGADNHLSNPESKFSKYLQHWSLTSMVSVDTLMREDDPENDLRVSKMMVDFMKRLEINSDRLADLQQRIEDFHARLRTAMSNRDSEAAKTQEIMHMLESERKTLRNLQRLHYDTWSGAKVQYLQWSPDGDDDIDNDDDCPNPIILLNPKKRKARWNAMVSTATEIQARHAMTIEQMSELVIRLKILEGDSEFQNDLSEIYEVVCAFLRCRMTQQLLCQHLVAMGKDALGTSMAKKIEAKRKVEALKAGLDPAEVEAKGGRVVGAINLESPVAPIVKSSVTEASQLCEATYLVSPPVSFLLATEVILEETTGGNNNDNETTLDQQQETTSSIYENVSVTFVRSWLQYTLIELLKNAMVATVESNLEITKAALEENFSDSSDDSDEDESDSDSDCPEQLPSLYIHVFDDDQQDNVVIQIHDQGGGVKEDFDLESLFRFGQRDTVWDRMDEQQTYSQVRSPLRGLGVGLSLSRWHMRHFGGDLTLERRPSGSLRIRSDSGRRSKWHVLGKGMTATITIPKDAGIPLVIS